MGGAFIDLQAMNSLVQTMDTAASDLRGVKGDLAGILGGVELDTSPPHPLETAASWVDSEVPGLRRRLALAQQIQGSNPKFTKGTPIPIDESKLSKLTPTQAQQKAQAAAAAMKSADGKPSADLIKEISENQDDPYYASAFAKQFSPAELAGVVKGLNRGYPGTRIAGSELTDDQKQWNDTYRTQLHALSGVLGTATRSTEPDLKMSADWTQQWSDEITADIKSNDDGTTNQGNALALSLLIKNGTYGTDFLGKVAEDAYKYERSKGDDNDPVWAPKTNDEVWDPDMPDGHAPNKDVMANILKGLGHNPLAATNFFDGDESESTKIHDKDVTVDSRLKYFIQDRKWESPDVLSDDGDGLGDAIRAASTYYRDSGYLGNQSATIASQSIALIAAHDGYGHRDSNFGNWILHGGGSSGWHMPGALQNDMAEVIGRYAPDLYRVYADSDAKGEQVPPWTQAAGAQNVPGDPTGMAVSRDDLKKLLQSMNGNDTAMQTMSSSILAYNQYQTNHVMSQLGDDTKADVLHGGNFPPLTAVMKNGPNVLSSFISDAYDGAKNEEEIKNKNTEMTNKFLDMAGSLPATDLLKISNPVAGWAFDTIEGELLDHAKGEPVDEADKLYSGSANNMTDKLTHNFQNQMVQNGFYDPKVLKILQDKYGTSDHGVTGIPPAGSDGKNPVNYDDNGKPTGFDYSSEAYQNWANGLWDKDKNPNAGTMPGGQLSQEVKEIYVSAYGVHF